MTSSEYSAPVRNITTVEYKIDGCTIRRHVDHDAGDLVTWTVYAPSGFKVNEYKTFRGVRRAINRLGEWNDTIADSTQHAAALHAAEHGNAPVGEPEPAAAELIAETEALIADLAERYEEVHKALTVPGAVQLAEAMWASIQEDLSEGVQPASVATFSELHEHVDANCYALDHLPDYSFEQHNDLINAAEDICDVRLRETAPERLAASILKQIDDDIVAEVMPVTMASLEELREYVEVDDYLRGRGILLAARVDGDKDAALMIERALAVVDAALTERTHHGATLEAECDTCEETFIPAGADDMRHMAKSDGSPCEGHGYGRLRAVFGAPQRIEPADDPRDDLVHPFE